MKSSVKPTLIAAAVASVLGTGAAYALAPNANINYTFYAGGGSAQVNAVVWAATQNMVAGTIDSYSDAGSKDSSAYRIISGTTSTAIGSGAAAIPAGSNILFFYKFNGGSFPNGVQPQLGSGANLVYPPVSSVTAATATGNAYPLPTYSISASGETDGHVPDWGITDVEVSLFNFADNLNGVAQLTSAQVNAIAQDGIYDNLFGVAVSNALYNGTHPKTSFTKQEVAGILKGQFTDWSQLFADDGTALSAGPVLLLDRGSGSGTKAAGNQYFLNYPGGIATSGSVAPGSVTSATVNSYTGTVLSLTSTSYQDVKEASSTAIVNDLQAANAAGKRAIAVLGLEFPPALYQGSAGTNQYSFVAINGVGPDTGTSSDNINGTVATKYTNVITGKYDFFYQNSLNTRSGFLTNGTVNASWTNALKNNFQSPNISGCHSASGVSGLLLDPKIIGSLQTGVVTGTRQKHSTAPLQPWFDATTASVSCSDGL
ncbi:MAG: hypothetical protein M3N97_15650 [Pseudomonadota bacterium]|nr:hypothetical protein [Pseudomonadota bacterium]